MATIENILLKKGSEVISTLPDTTIRQAVEKMAEANVGCLIIEYASKVIGIFTERDLLHRVTIRQMDLDTTTVEEVMTSPVEACSPYDDISDVTDTLCERQFRHLLVIDDGEPVGVISLRDLAPALRDKLHELHATV
jgi:CBS domain-containing protein